MNYRAKGWVCPLDHVNILSHGNGDEAYIVASGIVLDIGPIVHNGRFHRAGRVLLDEGGRIGTFAMGNIVVSGQFPASDDCDDCADLGDLRPAASLCDH